MGCRLCDQFGPADHDSPPSHQTIMDWQAHWAGSAGWSRKQELFAHKKAARELLAAKKKG